MSDTMSNQEKARQQTGFSSGWSDPNSGYNNQRTENEQVVADDPDGTKANGSIYLWNPNALNTQGLFPSRFPSTVGSYDELIKLIRDDMSYSERLQFKRKLWSAGFYTAGLESPAAVSKTDDGQVYSGLNIREGLTGGWDPQQDDAALKLLFNTYKETNKNVERTGSALDLDNVWADTLLTIGSQTRDDIVTNYDLPGLALTLQTWSEKNLGRNLTDSEVQKIFQQTLAFDQEPGEISGSSQWSATNIQSDPLSRRQIVTGGGDNSSAINFGRGLATTYNLVVDASLNMSPKSIGATAEFEDAFKEGRAVKITGDLQRMIKLHEWANTQKRPDGVFENVRFIYENNSNEPSAILISMNDGSKIPPIAASDFSYGQRGTDLDKFLDSVKRPGDVYAYSWEGEGPNRRGAYGMSDQIWEFYSNQLGIDSGDTSITSQDRVARAYVSDLWSRYGSWKEVALALRVNEDTANRRKAERENQGEGFVDIVTDPNELSWADQAIAKMGSWTPVLNSSKSQSLYDSMYGANAAYIPANLYAGVPNPGTNTENKMTWIAQQAFQTEIDSSGMLIDVIKSAGKKRFRTYDEWKATQ
jgi:hypothetical protein